MYAVKNDGTGWRSVNKKTDCFDDEHLSKIQPEEIKQVKSQITNLEFLDRFTNEEQLAIVEETMTNVKLKLWYDRLLAEASVDTKSPKIVDGVDLLISTGLVKESKREKLLNI